MFLTRFIVLLTSLRLVPLYPIEVCHFVTFQRQILTRVGYLQDVLNELVSIRSSIIKDSVISKCLVNSFTGRVLATMSMDTRDSIYPQLGLQTRPKKRLRLSYFQKHYPLGSDCLWHPSKFSQISVNVLKLLNLQVILYNEMISIIQSENTTGPIRLKFCTKLDNLHTQA